MMSAAEYILAAKLVDNIDLLSLIRKHVPQLKYIGSEEIFPDYPTVPYSHIDSIADPDTIFLVRIKPWLCNTYKCMEPNVRNRNAMIFCQTYHGEANA